MKKKWQLLMSSCLLSAAIYAQPIINTPVSGGQDSQDFWSRQGNTLVNGSNNVMGFRAGVNSQVWFQTNGFSRMMINNGLGGFADGRIGIGNNLPGGFIPQTRVHIHTSTANRSDLMFTNLLSGVGLFDGFRIGLNPTALIARLAMQEPTGDMRFSTGGLFDRMGLNANGRGVISPNIAPLIAGLTNRFTIESDPLDATPSGLRLLNLPCTSPIVAQCNPLAPVFLSVDAAGNVILVGPPGGLFSGANNGLTVIGGIVQLGNGLCNGTGQFTSDREIPLNNFDLYFNDASANTGSIRIGTNNTCGAINSRLDVINNSKQFGVWVETILGAGTAAVGGRIGAQNLSAGLNAVGLQVFAQSTGGTATGLNAVSLGGSTTPLTFSIGLNANSFNPSGVSTQCIGVNGLSRNGLTYAIAGNFDVNASTSPLNIGLQVELIGNTAAGQNFGAQIILNTNNPLSTEFGVFSSVPSATTGVGPDWSGFFVGDVFTTTNYFISDKNLKKDIKPIENSLSIINKLNPVNYLFDTENHKELGLSDGKQWGFVSQEIKQVLPELTTTINYPEIKDSTGKIILEKQEYLGLNYNGFIAILTQGIKEQQKMIEDQQKQIDELKTLVGTQNGGNGSVKINNQTNELSDKDVVVLNQNAPNPFAENTVITFNIPENYGFAQIIFYNSMGQVIKIQDIKEKGKGQLTVYANDLSNGYYTYSLVIDGKVVDTKKMQKMK